MIKSPIEFHKLFPKVRVNNPAEEIKKRLKSLCRSETLKYCIHLNLFVSDLDHPRYSLAEQQDLISMFLDRQDLKEVYALGTEELFFHRAQLLELIRYASFYCPDSDCHRTPVQSRTSKLKFVQAALLASEIAMNRIGLDPEEYQKVANKQEMLLRGVRVSALTSLHIMDPARAFGRGKLLFSDYLPKEFPEFEQEFKSYSGLDLRAYFVCLLTVLVHYYHIPLSPGSEMRHLISIDLIRKHMSSLSNTFARYLELESQSIDELKIAFWGRDEEESAFSLKPIRERPILKLDEDKSIVMDPIMHLEKAQISPLFMLSGELNKRGINLQGHFGDAFENYAQGILEKMIVNEGAGSRFLQSDELKIDGDEICDACVIEGDSSLLFEMKAVWIRDDTVFDPDPKGYLDELRSKYGKEGNAAFQLARAVDRLISGRWQISNHDTQKTKRIYPILICYDPILNTPGHFWFFGSEFRAALHPESMVHDSKTIMTKLQWEIAPVTIMSIDVLEDLEASVKNFRLSDLLKDYFAYCDDNFRDIEDDFSVSEFIRRQYAAKMDLRGSLSEKAEETFGELLQFIKPVTKSEN